MALLLLQEGGNTAVPGKEETQQLKTCIQGQGSRDFPKLGHYLIRQIKILSTSAQTCALCCLRASFIAHKNQAVRACSASLSLSCCSATTASDVTVTLPEVTSGCHTDSSSATALTVGCTPTSCTNKPPVHTQKSQTPKGSQPKVELTANASPTLQPQMGKEPRARSECSEKQESKICRCS